MAKAFNGAIAMSLVSKRKLGLDDTVDDWLPGVWPLADAITVRQMLGHTAGLAGLHPPAGLHRRADADPAQYMSPLELIDFVNGSSPASIRARTTTTPTATTSWSG